LAPIAHTVLVITAGSDLIARTTVLALIVAVNLIVNIETKRRPT